MVWELTFVLGSTSAQAQNVEAVQHETRRDIALEVTQSYGDASAAKAQLQVQEASLAVYMKLLEQITRRARKGLYVQSDSVLAVLSRGVDWVVQQKSPVR